jgi:hypothetical protein
MWRAVIAWLAGVAFVLVGVELVLRILPVSTATLTGYFIEPEILTYPPEHRWRVSTGWDLRNSQQLSANNWGFVADHDFEANADAVALVGDSYVEASMLNANDRPAAQLERELASTRPVFALGGPGSSLLDYAERIRVVHQRLGVRDFVVLMEAGDVRQSLCGSGNVHSACLDAKTLERRTERRNPPSAIARLARESAAAQYFVGQLRLDPASIVRQTFRRSVPEDTPKVRRTAPSGSAAVDKPILFVEAVTRTFFDEIAPYTQGRLVIVVDGQRDPARPLDARLAAERRQFIQFAKAWGATVIDAELLYAEHARHSRRSLDVGPYDRHLNGLGVSLVAQAVAKALRQDEAR